MPSAENPNTSPPPTELRQATANSNGLVTPSKDHKASTKQSALLSTGTMRLGSRSPSSIPSSPTSVHSSSSAIFERDIEPLPAPSSPTPHIHAPNPHRIPRAKTTEQLELSVPSVLDSAAAILTTSSTAPEDDVSNVSVITPANGLIGRRSGFASPIGSSRSPSPSTSAANRNSIALTSVPLSFPPPFPAAREMSNSPPRPTLQTTVLNPLNPLQSGTSDTPSIVTPTTAYFTTTSMDSSPTTTTLEHPPHPLPLVPSGTAVPTLLPVLSHPPSPTQAHKRLSFMAYSDLLTSTPASLQPLSSLTTSASTSEPPPHIPSVSGLTTHTATSSSAGSIHHWGPGEAGGIGSMESVGRERDSVILMEDVGGEWEREGFGGGLEERLESMIRVGALPAVAHGTGTDAMTTS